MREHRTALMVFTVLMLVASGLAILPAAAATVCDDAYVSVNGNTIEVAPTGVDDTANLQCALDLAASMPWAKVVLGEGDYFTSFLETEGFSGVFQGAGRNRTTLSTLPDGLDCVTQFEETGQVHLVTFAGDGNVTVKKLTIGVGGDAACEVPWFNNVDENGFGLVASDVDGLVFRSSLPVPGECDPPGSQDVDIKNVRVAGEAANFGDDLVVSNSFWRAVITGAYGFPDCVESRSTGGVAITDSVIKGSWAGVLLGWLDDSAATVSGNTFRNTGEALVVRDLSNTHVTVADNTMTRAHFWGVVAVAALPWIGEHPYSIEVRDNSIKGVLTADGVGALDLLWDTTGESTIDMDVVQNRIHIKSPYDGVRVYRAEGGEIAENMISGRGRAGIGVYASGWHVTGNNLARFHPTVADIWMNLISYDNTVECLSPDDRVRDEGTNNVAVGCWLFGGSDLATDQPSAESMGVTELVQNGGFIGLRE